MERVPQTAATGKHSVDVLLAQDVSDPLEAQRFQILTRNSSRVGIEQEPSFMGTLQGAVSNKHLDYYLDEYTFRFNRRSSRSRGLLFYRLIEYAVQAGPAPYAKIVGTKDVDHNI